MDSSAAGERKMNVCIWVLATGKKFQKDFMKKEKKIHRVCAL